MKINILGYALITLVLIVSIRLKLELAADRLADVNMKMEKLVKSVAKKYPNKENVKRLVKGYNPKKIYETLPTSKYTAYSENKGEKLAFC